MMSTEPNRTNTRSRSVGMRFSVRRSALGRIEKLSENSIDPIFRARSIYRSSRPVVCCIDRTLKKFDE